MEVCIIIFFDAKKNSNKAKKNSGRFAADFRQKKLRNAKKKLGASRRFCKKKLKRVFFLLNFAKKKH